MSQNLKIKATVDAQQATAELKKLTSQVKSVSSQMKRGSISSKSYNSSINTLTKGLRSYISAYAAIEVSKKTVNSLADLETGFVGIQKTTNLAGDEFKKFQDDLGVLSEKLSGIDIKSLQDIATTAGQLGISGTQNILSFTEAIAKISVTTDLSAEEAAKGMAVFTNIMDIPIKETARLGSVMNELSNTSNATSSQILDFSRRLAGAAKIANYSGGEVMGIAATLADVGARIEGGGTAVSRVIIKMQENISGFAKVSGESLESFAKLMKDKPVAALELFVKKLGALKPEDKIKALNDLGLSSVETTSVMLRMAAASDKLTKNLATAKQEMKDNTSLNREFALQSATLESEIINLKKAFQLLLIALGEELIPALKDFFKSLASGVKDVTKFYKENKALAITIKDMVMLAGELYVFRRALLAVFGAETIAAMSATGVSVAAVTTGVKALIVQMKIFMVSPMGLALTALAAGFYTVNKAVETMSASMKEVDSITGAERRILALQEAMGKAGISTSEFIQLNTKDRQKLIDTIKEEIKQDTLLIEKNKTSKYKDTIEQTKQLSWHLAGLSQILDALEKKKPIGTDYADIMATYANTVSKTSDIISLTNVQQEEYIKKIDKTIKANEDEIDTLKRSYTNLDENKKKIEELIKVNDKYAKIKEEVSKLKPIATEDYQPIEAAQQKFIDKTVKNAKQRLKVSKNTAVEIQNRETKLYQDLKKLEDELAQIRTKYANERVSAADRIAEKIRVAQNKGLDDLGKYNSDQATADIKYGKAKNALAKGNLELAKKYLSEYYSLVDSYAGEEISKEKEVQTLDRETGKRKTETIKEVQVTRQQTLAEYQRDLQKGSKIEQDLISKVEEKEINAHNEKIAMKQVELKAVKVELQAQQEMVALYAKMISLSTGVKFEPDFAPFKKNIADIDALLLGLEDKKRVAKIDVVTDTGEAEKTIDKVQKKLTLNDTTVDVTADTTPADFGIDQLITTYNGDEINISINPEWDKAQKELDKLRNSEESKDIKQTISIDSREADIKMNSIQEPKKTTVSVKVDDSYAKRSLANLTKTETKIIRVQTVSANSSGGLIGAYADGGHIRRSGKIAGHDTSGSDDVKAMLTRGEFVQKVKAVDYYGADFMSKLNNLQIPKQSLPSFSNGGRVSYPIQAPKTPKFASGGYVSSKMTGRVVDINLNIGNKTFNMISEEEVANALAKYLNKGEF